MKYPDNSIWKIHQQKAFAYLNLKKPTDAKKEFIKAIEFSPENQIPVVEFKEIEPKKKRQKKE